MLSIDAGRLAPMTYNFQQHQHQQHQNFIGMAGSGFANRGKGDSIRKISIPSLPTISTSSYDDETSSVLPTPRSSSRAQLLAGLRTAPKTPTSAGFSDMAAMNMSMDSQFQVNSPRSSAPAAPLKTTRSLGFGGLRNMHAQNGIPRSSPPQQTQESFGYHSGNYGGLPTPPASSIYFNQGDSDHEAKMYADLLARNISLAQQQQLLQQQQIKIVQQAQQLQHVQQQMQQLQMQSPATQSFGTPPISPAVYSPTAPGYHNPALYNLYNNSLGAQYNGYQQQSQYQQSPVQLTPPLEQQHAAPLAVPSSSSPPASRSPAYTPPARRSPSPPKDNMRGEYVVTKKTPSPPPAPSTFRRGHKKCSSLSSCINASTIAATDAGPKTSVPKFSNVPSTPVNSTFGGRGDHPVRQPRGPPSLEEILAKPTTKHEGSKNFSSRQRRRALTKLVNAGMERRGARPTGSSAGAMTPVSENDIILNFEDADSNASSPHSGQSTPISSADEAINMTNEYANKRRSGLRVPQLALNSAEKRRSALF